ncbi:LytTR family DNA-binding domain-containing protein [Reyranella aquatilis]|uniref:LytTR family DNA-binding domain-containing protein n=1 Tax=Reyranella aquatilis TaxID=2035356 RepID=UPI001E57E3D7|nr:LytTR family DNA-binding domain-containing protein [Reyranella aquatilis]
MRESPYIRSLPIQLPAVAALAVVLGVIGPFGTYDHMDLGRRVAYFAIIGGLSWVQIVTLAAWFGRIEPIDRWPVAGRMTLVGVLASIPSSFEVILVQSWLGRPIPLSAAPSVFPENALLTTSIAVVFGLVVEQRLRAKADAELARVAALPPQPADVADSVSSPPSSPDFLRRVPPALGRDLLALEMEDHYLRIHTALGSDLVLMRLRDALAELGPDRGRQVHRSWWVATGAIASVDRTGGRLVLTLRNGLKVPVSKTYRDSVREAGWLEK